MNSIFAIHPYKDDGLWVFDDPAVGLEKEPFVQGADVIIDRLAESIPYASLGFTLRFSANTFPDAEVILEWRREDCGGNWYYSPALGLEGWLCPALFQYFNLAPPRIFAQFKARDRQ